MRRLTSLVLLMMMMTLGLDAHVAFSQQAGAAHAPKEVVRARSADEYGNALGEKNGNNEKNLRFAGPINEVEAKRLKLILLLMMSLGQSRTLGY